MLTDAELIELRYGGRPAAALRLVKGFYFGVFINCYVLGWVLKAVTKVMAEVTDLPPTWVLGGAGAVALAYTMTAGLKGVVWTDFFQYGVALVGSALLAVYALDAVGGLSGLVAGLDQRFGSAEAVLRFVPRLDAPPAGGEMAFMPASVFLVYAGVQ